MVCEEIPLSKEDGEEVMRKRLDRQVSDILANTILFFSGVTISVKLCVYLSCNTSQIQSTTCIMNMLLPYQILWKFEV